MFEIIVLFLTGLLFTACFFSPFGGIRRSSFQSALAERDALTPVPSEVTLRSDAESVSFLNYLQKEIEAELFPRPTCSVLQRHYDALVAVELENRLAMMAE